MKSKKNGERHILTQKRGKPSTGTLNKKQGGWWRDTKKERSVRREEVAVKHLKGIQPGHGVESTTL